MLLAKIDLNGVRNLREFGNRIIRGGNQGLDDANLRSLHLKNERIDRTYQRPIPLNKSGRPRWQRTFAYRDHQAISIRRFERSVFSRGPASRPITNYPGGYEQRLAKIPPGRDGIDRRNDAAGETEAIMRLEARGIVEWALVRELKR